MIQTNPQFWLNPLLSAILIIQRVVQICEPPSHLLKGKNKLLQVPTFICERHRYDIVHSSTMQACAMCNKKRSRKATSPQSIMMTITYR